MNKIFQEIECLTEHSKLLSGEYLRKNWFKKADKRYMSHYLQKFIEYNREYLEFLGVTASIEGSDPKVSLRFKSSQYIGVIPLRSPDTGKQIGDFIVSPRYFSKDKQHDYIKILNLVNKSINAEFKNSIPLLSGRNFQPPLYYEAVIFIKELLKLVQTKWVKFSNKEVMSNTAIGEVNWKKYIQNEYKVENQLKYPVNKNILTEYHKEYEHLKYVFNLCKNEILGTTTPQEIKLSIRRLISFLEEKLRFHKSIYTQKIQIREADPMLVKRIKIQANKILSANLSRSIAWRIDFNEVFERYVQYLFKEVTQEVGGEFYPNFRIKSSTNKRFEWELKYLEPDGIYKKGNNITIFIDAKYKSHLLNKYSKEEELKNTFRTDLHQIMAYTTFSFQNTKYGFLCYPSMINETKTINFYNPINDSNTNITLIGIPLDINYIHKVKKIIFNKIDEIEKSIINVKK